MNIIKNYYFQSTHLTLFLLSLCMSSQGTCQSDLTVMHLKQLNERVSQTVAPIPDSVLNDVAINLRLSLPGISFEPDHESAPSMKEFIPNGPTYIRETTKIILAIMKSNSLKTGFNKNKENPILVTVESVLVKINKSIDPDWELLSVSSNVMPPAGTPNATAGMVPEAIADLELRKQYLDSIDQNRQNNLKNGQQRALRDAKNKLLSAIANLVLTGGVDWEKGEVISQFCKDGESKIILEKYLKRGK